MTCKSHTYVASYRYFNISPRGEVGFRTNKDPPAGGDNSVSTVILLRPKASIDVSAARVLMQPLRAASSWRIALSLIPCLLNLSGPLSHDGATACHARYFPRQMGNVVPSISHNKYSVYHSHSRQRPSNRKFRAKGSKQACQRQPLYRTVPHRTVVRPRTPAKDASVASTSGPSPSRLPSTGPTQVANK